MQPSHRPPLLLAVVLAGCIRVEPPTTPSPAPHQFERLLTPGVPNLLLPMRVAIDPTRRRAVVVSLTTPTVAEVDIDSGELLAVHELGDDVQLRLAQPALTDDGAIWIASAARPALLRILPEGGEVDVPATDIGQGLAAVPLLRDSVAVAALEDDGGGAIIHIDSTGKTLQRLVIEGVPVALQADGDQLVALAVDGESTSILLIDAATFTLTHSCPMPAVLHNVDAFGPTDDRRYAATNDTEIWVSGCPADDAQSLSLGTENRQVIGFSDHFLVLDRVGSTALDGPNWGTVWSLDADLNEAAPPFASGKHTAYGALDSLTGRIWANSEGTTELWELDPTTGETLQTVSLGLHLEGPLGDPEQPGIAFVSGRLTGTLARVDLDGVAPDQPVVITKDEVLWPMSLNWLDGDLYVMGGLDLSVSQLDPATMMPLATATTGLPENASLTLSAMTTRPAAGTMLLTNGQTNDVYEVDPTTGAVLQQIQTAGEPPRDLQLPGRLEVLVVDDVAFTVRTHDGTIGRIDLDSGALTHSTSAPDEVLERLETRTPIELARLVGDPAVLYVGGAAYDPLDLTRLTELDLDVDQVLGERSTGERVAWLADEAVFIAVDATGAELDRWSAESSWGDPTFNWVAAWGDRVLHTDFGKAAIHSNDVGDD